MDVTGLTEFLDSQYGHGTWREWFTKRLRVIPAKINPEIREQFISDFIVAYAAFNPFLIRDCEEGTMIGVDWKLANYAWGKCRNRADDTRPLPIQADWDKNHPWGKCQPSSIPWWLAEIAYSVYMSKYGTSQTLQRLSDRGGFGRGELMDLLMEVRPHNMSRHIEQGRLNE